MKTILISPLVVLFLLTLLSLSEVPALWRKKYWKELVCLVFVILACNVIGFIAGFKQDFPNPLKGFLLLINPAKEWIEQMLSP